MTLVQKIDRLIEHSLSALAADSHVMQWRAKENNWVNYFAMRYVLQHCRPDGVISHPAQIGIEVSVPQPPKFEKPTVRRDLVIWPTIGMTCWNESWVPACHPLAIAEWKVHRPRHPARHVVHEREWLKSYCRWQPSVVAYAIEVDGTKAPVTITCSRFLGKSAKPNWLTFRCE